MPVAIAAPIRVSRALASLVDVVVVFVLAVAGGVAAVLVLAIVIVGFVIVGAVRIVGFVPSVGVIVFTWAEGIS